MSRKALIPKALHNQVMPAGDRRRLRMCFIQAGFLARPFFAAFRLSTSDRKPQILRGEKCRLAGERTYSDGLAPAFNGIPYYLLIKEHLNYIIFKGVYSF